MRYGELKKILRKNGCEKIAEGKRHEKWKSDITGKVFPVSRHDREEVPTGTLNNILKDAGLK
ncbi:MAG: type II toxin-antitoxin system HicA family toxin [Pseudoramibacter sp.]